MSTSHWDHTRNETRHGTWLRPSPEDRLTARRGSYVGSILVNAFLLYAAHNVLRWEVPYFTPAWNDVLWAVDLSLTASIVAHALLLAYDTTWFRHLVDLVTTGLAIVVGYQLYAVYPFAAGGWDSLLRFGLLGVLMAMIMAMLVLAIVTLADALSYTIREVTGAAPW